MSARSVKLFVGNLPWSICHRELREYFQRFGRVMSSQVMFVSTAVDSKLVFLAIID
jgi:RNA recognition motif-containing protein